MGGSDGITLLSLRSSQYPTLFFVNVTPLHIQRVFWRNAYISRPSDYYITLELTRSALRPEIDKAWVWSYTLSHVLGIPLTIIQLNPHISGSYRKLSLKYHADRNKEITAQENFAAVAEAYDVLSTGNWMLILSINIYMHNYILICILGM